jgi:tRNA threonylcarbamoyladenosine biosynthesis protein TsaB
VSVTLAIEASQPAAEVALRDGSGLEHVEPVRAGARHDDDLLPAIVRLFERTQTRRADLRAIGISIGPGGFTGLRIAIATAKLLAEGLGASLVAVPTALVVAASTFLPAQSPALILLASKEHSAWATRARFRNRAWEEEDDTPAFLADAGNLPLHDNPTVVADQHLPPVLRARLSSEPVPPQFSARACLALTERALAAGRTIDPLRLLPLYPRPPEAVTLWEKRHIP